MDVFGGDIILDLFSSPTPFYLIKLFPFTFLISHLFLLNFSKLLMLL